MTAASSIAPAHAEGTAPPRTAAAPPAVQFLALLFPVGGGTVTDGAALSPPTTTPAGPRLPVPKSATTTAAAPSAAASAAASATSDPQPVSPPALPLSPPIVLPLPAAPQPPATGSIEALADALRAGTAIVGSASTSPAAAPQPAETTKDLAALAVALSKNSSAAAPAAPAASPAAPNTSAARFASSPQSATTATATSSVPSAAGATPLPTAAAAIATDGVRLPSQPRPAATSVSYEQANDTEEPGASGGHAIAPADSAHALPKAAATPIDGGDAANPVLVAPNKPAPAFAVSASPTSDVETGVPPAPIASSDDADPAPPAEAAAAPPPPVQAAPAASPSPGIATAPPLPTHTVVEQVAINLGQAAKNGVERIQIQLQPADLGAIEVKLSVSHEGRVEVVVSADRSDTLNLLQQDAGNLAQALRDAGLQADSSSLSFNLRGGPQQSFQQSSASSGGLQNRALTAPEETAQSNQLRRHAGVLDIHV